MEHVVEEGGTSRGFETNLYKYSSDIIPGCNLKGEDCSDESQL